MTVFDGSDDGVALVHGLDVHQDNARIVPVDETDFGLTGHDAAEHKLVWTASAALLR